MKNISAPLNSDQSAQEAPSSGLGPDEREMVWILGQPQLQDYLDFQTTKVIRDGDCDLRAHAADWREANDLYYDLEQTEAGLADTIDCRPLPEHMRGLAREVEDHRWFKASFADLPYSFELVELDKLVISQIQVEAGYSRRIADELGASPSDEALFRFCLPLDRQFPPYRVRRLGSSRFQFTSYSSDFREHRPILMQGADLGALALDHPATAMIGVPIGFGSNFLSGIRSDSRVLLQNGYHRAYALRSAGFTHAWCIVETVTRKDELRLSADEDVMEDPEFYFASRRPPMLKDFFDPRLARHFRARRSEFVIDVEISVRSLGAMDVTTG